MVTRTLGPATTTWEEEADVFTMTEIP